ncbi:MAG TPA: dicarboxylate/amino acid:cation symporter [Fimbriimonadaceae bacterium]|nr:dicarboxylate/amino acid:cation symporter [Fimbriimonadaceae bacterium]
MTIVILDAYRRLPLFVRILLGAALGIAVGAAMGRHAESFKPFADLVLKLLRLLATPLIFLSILHSLLTAEIRGRSAGKLAWLLLSNTCVAIALGLLVVNLLAPGGHVAFPPPSGPLDKRPFDPVTDLLGKIPADFVSPFANNEVIGLIVVGVALGLALRALRAEEHEARIGTLVGWVKLGLDLTMKLLHWLFELVPLAVLAIIARVVGATGIAPLLNMIWFVASVALALALMACFYAVRLRLSSTVRPGRFFRGASDAFALAFSTASSAATLPVTYECATKKLDVREESASLGILVGGTFNHDGTALYEAMAALFVSQALGMHLPLGHQIVVALMSIIASVGAAGIPQAGFVTMIAVFSAVRLPIEYIPLLLPLDWLLDRCRTTVNVMGDLVSTCIVDRQPT